MKYLILAAKGIAYGVTHIVPGLGGGLVLILMGIYEPFVDAVGNLLDFKRIKQHLGFLVPLGIGMVIGMVLSALLIASFLEGYPVGTNLFFMGLLLGTIPSVLRIHKDMRPTPWRIVALLLGVAAVVAIKALEAGISAAGSSLTLADISGGLGALYNAFVSFLAGGASVTPGMDGSLVLILGGTYGPALHAVKDMVQVALQWLSGDGLGQVRGLIVVVLTTVIGAGLGILIFSKLIDTLIKRSPALAYYGVLGLVLGSIYALWPTQTARLPWWALVLCVLVGAVAAILLADRSDSEPEGEES